VHATGLWNQLKIDKTFILSSIDNTDAVKPEISIEMLKKNSYLDIAVKGNTADSLIRGIVN
jgi:hypothetical protein